MRSTGESGSRTAGSQDSCTLYLDYVARQTDGAVIGEALRQARQRAEMTQEELADKTGLSVRAISDLERGLTARPRRSSVQLLADALGISPPGQEPSADALPGGIYSITPIPSSPGAALLPPPQPTSPSPAQLPAAISDFTGRAEQLSRLREVLAGSPGIGPEATRVVLVAGTGGVGKTTLAVHGAHLVADQFPDGQLYASLLGATHPVSPANVLARFLRDLGMDGAQLPTDPEELAALYRTRLAGRRLLIVLDDARDATQVGPLVPGSPPCAVLVTSRNQLPDLPRTATIDLNVLPPDEARILFGKVAGEQRTCAEPDAVEEVLAVCGGLPLAIRIAGARLATRGGWNVRTLADRLSDEHGRLDELRAGNLAVRASFEVSYASLPGPLKSAGVDSARTFRLLGLWTGPSISLPAAGALLGEQVPSTEAALEVLLDARLLEEPAPGTYCFHDLIRLYAADRGWAEETQEDRQAAFIRLLTWYLHTTDASARVISPHRARVPLCPAPAPVHPLKFASLDQAVDWCESERANLAAATRLAAEHRLHEIAWKLPTAAMSFYYRRNYWTDWLATHETALTSARSLGDRHAQAWVLTTLGMAYGQQNREDSVTCFEQARALFRETGDTKGEMRAIGNLANAYLRLGCFEAARDAAQQAVAMNKEAGNAYGEGLSRNILGCARGELGKLSEAVDDLQQALIICRDLGDGMTEATCLTDLGRVYLDQGKTETGLEFLRKALIIQEDIGELSCRATTLWHLGRAEGSSGNAETARKYLTEGLDLAQRIGELALTKEIQGELKNILNCGVHGREIEPLPACTADRPERNRSGTNRRILTSFDGQLSLGPGGEWLRGDQVSRRAAARVLSISTAGRP
jgi:transcriptional regulator with XRE-family HTH domain/tetratricopeptide (TPR) repeat protein